MSRADELVANYASIGLLKWRWWWWWCKIRFFFLIYPPIKSILCSGKITKLASKWFTKHLRGVINLNGRKIIKNNCFNNNTWNWTISILTTNYCNNFKFLNEDGTYLLFSRPTFFFRNWLILVWNLKFERLKVQKKQFDPDSLVHYWLKWWNQLTCFTLFDTYFENWWIVSFKKR